MFDEPRVSVVERTNVRHYARPDDEPPYDLVTADLSFISLALVLPRIAAHSGGGAVESTALRRTFDAYYEAVSSVDQKGGGERTRPRLHAAGRRRPPLRAAARRPYVQCGGDRGEPELPMALQRRPRALLPRCRRKSSRPLPEY